MFGEKKLKNRIPQAKKSIIYGLIHLLTAVIPFLMISLKFGTNNFLNLLFFVIGWLALFLFWNKRKDSENYVLVTGFLGPIVLIYGVFLLVLEVIRRNLEKYV